MKGRVTLVNRELGWFAIQQENKDVTVVDGLGDPLPRVHDVVEGNLHSTTRETLSNRTTGDALIIRVIGTGQGMAWAGSLMQQGRSGMAGMPARMRASGSRRDPAMRDG